MTKGTIKLIRLLRTGEPARDMETARQVKEMSENGGCNGVIINDKVFAGVTKRYCELAGIAIVETNIRSRKEANFFYQSLIAGDYLQTTESMHPIILGILEKTAEKGGFAISASRLDI